MATSQRDECLRERAWRPAVTGLGAVAVALVMTSCGSGQATGDGPPVTVTATATVTATVTDTVEPPEPSASSPSSMTGATSARTKTGGTSDTVIVPNGVGRDYQSAQNRWRAAGLIVGPGIDATGANRIMVLDSNWVVLTQTPEAGSKAKAGDTITATVKKYTDD
jgi:hypothetical protein